MEMLNQNPHSEEEETKACHPECSEEPTKKAKRHTGPVKTIDLAEASSARILMEHLIKRSKGRFKLSLNKEKADIRYCHCNVDDEEILKLLKTKGRVSVRYPNIRGLVHKDMFARWTKLCTELQPDAFSFIPPSFEYPCEAGRLEAYMKKNPGCCFIAKPQSGSQGEAMLLFRDKKELDLTLSCRHNPEYVIQRYIDKPLLLNGFKFDLRIYVALVGTGLNGDQMHAFVFDEGLARFCTQKYEKPTKENMRNEYMHLTNYSINKHSDDYIWEPEDVLSINDGSKRTMTALYKELAQMGYDPEEIKESIKYTCQGLMQMLSQLVQHQLVNTKPEEIKGKVFQVFGFDVLLDQNLKAWVLEINDHPSMNVMFTKEFMAPAKEDEILS